MAEFDPEEIVTAIQTHPAVLGVYREDVPPDVYGRFVVRIDDPEAQGKLRAKVAKFTGLPVSLRFIGLDDEVPENCLWQRVRQAVRTTGPGSRERGRRHKEAAPVPPPSRSEIAEMYKQHVLKVRNELLAEEGLAPLAIAGFIVDVRDPCCPNKFREMLGEDFVRHCAASGKVPVASGALPKHILARLMDPICRRIEGMEAPLILVADPPVPKLVKMLQLWNLPNELPTVLVYQGKVSLVSVVVPSVIVPTTLVQ